MRSPLLLPAALLLLAATAPTPAHACSRVAMASPNATSSVAGRTMDWPVDTVPDLVASPLGIARDGGVGTGSLAWTAAHGSVCVWFQGLGCVEGMNGAGLSGGMNFLREAVIPDLGEARAAAAGADNAPPLLSITQWLQHALDSYASVDEVVAALNTTDPPPYALTTLTLSTGDKALGHLMFTDTTGASAIVEPVAGGRLAVYRSADGSSADDITRGALAVMTNGPPLPAMLDLADEVAGRVPGGSSSSTDRFARAAYWRQRTPVPADPAAAAAVVRSIMRTLASPVGALSKPGSPESRATRWASMSDMTRRVFWLEPAEALAVTVVDLAPLGLESATTPVRLLETGTRQGQLGGSVGLESWKVVPAGSMPGMVGFKGKAGAGVEAASAHTS